MPRRIRRDAQYEDTYKKLCEGDQAVFSMYKYAFLMSACIGFKMGQRKPLTRPEKDFHWEVFDGFESIINAIALAETNDFKVIVDEKDDLLDDRVTIIEEYANAGIEYIKSEVLDKGGAPTENLITYLYAQKGSNSNQGIDLGFLSELSDLGNEL